MEQKKAISQVIVISLILLIGIIAAIAVGSWYTSLTSSLKAKKAQQLGFISDSYELLGIEYNTSYYVYIKNNNYGYIVIKELKLNDEVCTLPETNIIDGKQISKIEIVCPTINAMNDLFIDASSNVIQGKVKLLD